MPKNRQSVIHRSFPPLRNRRWQFLLPTAGIVVLAAISAGSFPRLATEAAMPCETCHVSAAGGGARNEFGNHAVALNELCLPQTKQYFLDKYQPPRVAKSLVVGFDTRHLVLDDGMVIRMQTDGYLSFEPYKGLLYHLRLSDIGIRENFALLTLHDYAYHLKVGRFTPAFGLRNSDHTAYNRVRTGNGPQVYLDGLSVGVRRWGTNVMAEAFDYFGQGIYGLHAYRLGVIDPLSYQLGFSIRATEKVLGSHGQYPQAQAIFGGVSWGRATLLGELDRVGDAGDTLIVYTQLAARLEYGLYLIGEYNFFDGDRDADTGVDEFVRFSLEFYPIPFVQLRPSYTYYTSGLLKDQNDFFLLVHFGY